MLVNEENSSKFFDLKQINYSKSTKNIKIREEGKEKKIISEQKENLQTETAHFNRNFHTQNRKTETSSIQDNLPLKKQESNTKIPPFNIKQKNFIKNYHSPSPLKVSRNNNKQNHNKGGRSISKEKDHLVLLIPILTVAL